MNFVPPAPTTPCVKICVVDPLSSLCIGCGRTVAEIALWPEMGEAERRAIMIDLPQRLSAARSRGMREGRVGERARRRERQGAPSPKSLPPASWR